MRRLFARFSVIIFVSLILTACQSNEGVKPLDVAKGFFTGPLPQGLPVFIEINEPFWAHDPDADESENEKSLSLFSVALPEDGEVVRQNDESESDEIVSQDGETVRKPIPIFTTSSDYVTSLNTIDDNAARTEISILVNKGNVYKVDHLNGSIRLINHFVDKICEIIPVEIIETTSTNSNSDVTHTILHDELIYVVTVDGAVTESDCANPSNKLKRFYELPLNYQFNADEDDETKTNELKPPVSESLARAKLVFGWVDDEVTVANDDQRLSYGYLGYSIAENKLRFFDDKRAEVWCQPRKLQTFVVEDIGQDEYSPNYLFKLTELEQQQYMLQLGLDVFVFDSTSELFLKPPNKSYCEAVSLSETETAPESEIKSPSDIEIENILTDRIFKTEITLAGTSKTSETVQAVTVLSDDDELVFVDGSKIFRYNYEPSSSPVTTRNFMVKKQNPVSIDQVEYRSTYPFSQFDLTGCDDIENVFECSAAHDLESNAWQFFSECEADKGCSFTNENSDFCFTAEELESDPTAGSLCTATDYRHLDELNNVNNDAEFRGFMQYDSAYIHSLDYILHDNSLFITARMSEKEILLRYFYNVDLSEAKSDRETILFGERLEHFGFDVYLNNNNLFATVLWKRQHRENECYKNYQQVECLLGSDEEGVSNECTGRDLADGACFNGFQEYESVALFCTEAEIANGTCTDNEIMNTNNLTVNQADESGKWLRMLDVGAIDDNKNVMYLLSDVKTSVIDEGVLTDPYLHSVDNADGSPSASNILGQINGKVESVVSGWISNDNQARLDVITEEVELSKVVALNTVQSVANIHYITDPKLDNGASPSDPDDGINKQLINVGGLKFIRSITRINDEE